MTNINLTSNLLNFTLDNMGTGASFIIALSSKDLIYSFVNDIILPLMNNYLFFIKNDKPNFKNLFINLITWLLVLINTFVFYTLLFKLNKKKTDKKDSDKN
jgi:hypothetical protein